MALKDLTNPEMRVYEYIRNNDFSSVPWNTANAAQDLGMKEEDVYIALASLTKKIRDNIWIYYDSGHLHVVAD